ncbi:MAG: hypothetical protein ABSG76_13850 [Xanthobacteraceae bacterium]
MTAIDELGEAGAAAAMARSRELAEAVDPPWVEEVERTWPMPIAHEYSRFRTELRRSAIASILWQFKDLAEVLIRFPGLVLAAEVIERGTPDQQLRVRSRLVSGPLTLGTWLRLLRDELSAGIVADPARFRPSCVAIARQVIQVDAQHKTGVTEWGRFLADLVQWRNSDFGHGAFRLDPREYLPGLETLVGRLNRHLAAQAAGRLWHDVCVATADRGVALTGAARPDLGTAAAGGGDEETALFLHQDSTSQPLRLSPFIALRRCRVCGRRDVFCYDGRSGTSFGFIDFATGHAFTLAAHRVPDLANVMMAPAIVDIEGGDLDDAFSDTGIEAALDVATLRARYETPSYLRKPVADFVRNRSRGVAWLRAPGQTGKSMLVRGLAEPDEVGEPPLLPDLMVAAFHIRREFRFSAIQFQEFLEIDLARDLLQIAGRHRRIGFALDAADRPAALAQFLALVMQATRRTERLLICLDGLDEAPDGSEIIDFLPRAAQLPDRVYLLLTSRPLADCPPRSAQLLERGPGGDPDVMIVQVDLDETASDPASAGYRATVRRYFDRATEPLLLGRLRAGLSAVVERRTTGKTVVCRDDLSKALPARIRDRVRADWQELTSGLAISSPPAADRLAMVVEPILADADRTFADLWRAADGRFQLLSHLTQLYCDRGLTAVDIAALPKGSLLYHRYFELIERSAGAGKLWDLVLRIILLVAVESDAAEWMRRESSQVWRRMDGGSDLAALARRLGMTGRPARLALLLFELKEMFLVRRGAGVQRYHPASGDIVAVIRERWPSQHAAAHRDLATRNLDLLAAAGDPAAPADEELCATVAHAALCGLRHPGLDVGGPLATLLLGRSAIAHDESREHDAVALTTAGVELAGRQLRLSFDLRTAAFLPLQLRHRAMAGLAAGRVSQAFRDVEDAARLLDALRDMVDSAGRIRVDRDIALTLGVRADVRTTRGDWHAASVDYTEAIDLLMRTDAEPGLPDARPLLATLLHNRARARGLLGQDDEARADIDRAVALLGPAIDPGRAGDAADRARVMLAQTLVLRSVANLRSGDGVAALSDAEGAVGLLLSGEVDVGALSADHLDVAAGALAQLCRARGARRDFDSALRAAEDAMHLRLALRERVGPDCPPSMLAALAQARQDRGLALLGAGRQAEGLADIDGAIELGEAVGRAAGPDWEPSHRDALGGFYACRASFASVGGDPARAAADFARADELGFDRRELADILSADVAQLPVGE